MKLGLERATRIGTWNLELGTWSEDWNLDLELGLGFVIGAWNLEFRLGLGSWDGAWNLD